MALSADVLADRARLKKESRRWRVLAFLFLFGGLLAFSLIQDKMGGLTSGYIARVNVEGFIGDDVKRDEMLTDLGDDDKVKAVLVRFDSPGGSAVGGEELYRDFLKLSKKKPVVAVMRTTCTSACYMAAIGTSQIFASQSTITGSIGVLMEMAEFTELAKKLGIEPITVKSGTLKASPSPLEKFTPEAHDYIQGVINDTFAMFLGFVNERRKLAPEAIELIKDGRVFTGRQALPIHLIDAIGGEEEAISWLEKSQKLAKDLPVRDIEPKQDDEDWFGGVKQTIHGFLLGRASQRLDGLVSIWQPSIK